MKLLSVCGFLASGKTTLILEIAKRLKPVFGKIVIIENEIGQIGIDDQYLRRNGLEVQELDREVEGGGAGVDRGAQPSSG